MFMLFIVIWRRLVPLTVIRKLDVNPAISGGVILLGASK